MVPLCGGGATFMFDSTNTGTTHGGNFGCLYSHPNENWFYFKADTTGTLRMRTVTGRDHDFAIWGPYHTMEDAGIACGHLPAPMDCSYSSTAHEHQEVLNIEAGEFYIFLLSNYARVTQTVTVHVDSGSLSCAAVEAIVNPPPPEITRPPVGAHGDPHMVTWSGEKYDFHGVCDLVLASTPDLDIHIRTHEMKEWSYVEAASLRIGDDVLEVTGGKDNMNKVRFNGVVHEIEDSKEKVLDISGHPVVFTKTSDKSQEFEVHLGDNEKILFRTWNSFVSITVQNPSERNFGSSVGLMGSFPAGEKLARDNKTILSDVNEFGQEWQVNGDEAKLFHEAKGPQFPQKCEIPSSLEMRRRLEASKITVEEAEIACAHVESHLKDLCMFDVMATSDESVSGAY